MMINNPFKMNGLYGITVKDREGQLVAGKQLGITSNTVTYNGILEFFFGQRMAGGLVCKVGTGSTETSVLSTNLSNAINSYSPTTSPTTTERTTCEVDNGDGTSTFTYEYAFAFNLGQIVGTITEVGVVVSDRAYYPLLCGQLIKDEFGNPTSITLLEEEQLIVTYVMEFTVPNAPTIVGTGTVTDANEAVIGYTVWAQPYFIYPKGTSNGSNYLLRIRDGYRSASFRYNSFIGSDGQCFYVKLFQTVNASRELVLDPTRVVISHDKLTVAPGDFASNDIKYIGLFGGSRSNSVSDYHVDLVTREVVQRNNSHTAFLVEFDTPISKSSAEALTYDFSVEMPL